MKTLISLFAIFLCTIASANHPPQHPKDLGGYQAKIGYIVRIGSYHQINNARRALKVLQEKNYSTYTYIKKKLDKNDKILYSVQTLPIPHKRDAEEVFDDVMKSTDYLPLLVEL